MHPVVRSDERKALLAALCIPLLLLGACERTTYCCPEHVVVSHALIYGVVRSADGSGVAGAQVVSTLAGHSVMTTTRGVYRLPIPVPLLGPGDVTPLLDPRILTDREVLKLV